MSRDAIDLHDVGPDDLPVWAALSHRGFLAPNRPAASRMEGYRHALVEYRFRLARIGGVPCGAYRSWDVDLPVPGRATVRTRAIGSLSVLSTHRRRGVASAFIRDALDGGREAGAALSLLIPSEAPIYGRFGFGAATETVHLTVDTTRVHLGVPEGITLEATQDEALQEIAPALYAQVAAGMPGALPRTDQVWARSLGLASVEASEADLFRPAVIARDETGAVVGTASYRIDGDWELDRRAGIRLLDLTAATAPAYRALWGFLADLDLTDRIVAVDRPVHEPLAWMLPDRRAITQTHRTDFQWLRLLDVPTALAARTAAAPGSLVLEVVDPAGYAAGRWQMDADEGGHITLTSSSRSADVTLSAQTLASIYLGQVSLLQLNADEHRAGAVRILDAMLHWAPETAVGHTWF